MNKERLPSLKPQSIGISRRYKNIEDLAWAIYVGIKKLSFEPETAEYLNCILSLYSDRVRSVFGLDKNEVEMQIKTMWPTWKGILPLNDIGKDFAEMLGPMFISQQRFASQERQLKVIEFPKEGNYPLIDYFIWFRSSIKGVPYEKLKFSAKSNLATSANTVKFSTVYEDIMKWKHEVRKDFLDTWKDSTVFQMVKKCHELVNLKNKEYTISVSNEALRVWCLERHLGPRSLKITPASFWKEISSLLQEEIKNFFGAFIKGNIYYVVFNIDKRTGIPNFIYDFNTLKLVRVRLKELKEQIGFEPKFGEHRLIV